MYRDPLMYSVVLVGLGARGQVIRYGVYLSFFASTSLMTGTGAFVTPDTGFITMVPLPALLCTLSPYRVVCEVAVADAWVLLLPLAHIAIACESPAAGPVRSDPQNSRLPHSPNRLAPDRFRSLSRYFDWPSIDYNSILTDRLGTGNG